MAFNKTQTMNAVEAKVTEQNLLPTIKQYRAMGVDGIVNAIQGMKTTTGEYAMVTLLITLDSKLNGPNFSNPLAEQIWIEQGHKMVQYDGNAYRLSEKQLQVIARHFVSRTLSVEFA